MRDIKGNNSERVVLLNPLMGFSLRSKAIRSKIKPVPSSDNKSWCLGEKTKDDEIMFRRSLILAVMALFLTGCMSSSAIRAQNRENLMNLSPGLSKQNVLKVMGTETIMNDMGDTITNPYRTEMYRVNDNVFELLLYYTDIKRQDGAITDDELTPIVIKDGRLDGWGWSYWDDLVQKYEIRVR